MDRRGIGPVSTWIVAAGALAGLFATYWDDGWHTVVGRDDALIPPHLMLYASIATVGVVLATWVLRVLWKTRSVRTTLTTPGLPLAVAAGIVTAGAAPADAWWHAAFGRDAVLWSPPHLLSVIATAVLLVAIAIGLRPDVGAGARTAVGSALLGAGMVVLLEYDTDVPQFAGWLYVPLLVAVGLGVAWVIRALSGFRNAVTWAVLGYVAVRVVIAAVLAFAGWPGPDLPVPLLGLLLLDVQARRGDTRWPLAGVAIVLAQVAASASGLSSVGIADTMIGAALVVPLLLLLAFRGRGITRAAVVAAVVFVAIPAPPRAYAHDPGQGPQVATIEFEVTTDGVGGLAVRITRPEGLAVTDLHPRGILARRGGKVVEAPLAGVTEFTGRVALPEPGLWFVYAELDSGGRTLESWVPADFADQGVVAERRSLYLPAGTAPADAGQYLAGAGLLLVGATLVAWAATVVRRRSTISLSST